MKIACLQFNPIQRKHLRRLGRHAPKRVVIDAGNSNPREDAAARQTSSPSTGCTPVHGGQHPRPLRPYAGRRAPQRNATASPSPSRSRTQFLLDNASTSGSIFGVAGRRDALGGHRPRHDARNPFRPHRPARASARPAIRPAMWRSTTPQSKSLFTGDTLFRESIGRTDLPGGDYSWIMRSILDSADPAGRRGPEVYPGHGPESTTIGHEMPLQPLRRGGAQPSR